MGIHRKVLLPERKWIDFQKLVVDEAARSNLRLQRLSHKLLTQRQHYRENHYTDEVANLFFELVREALRQDTEARNRAAASEERKPDGGSSEIL